MRSDIVLAKRAEPEGAGDAASRAPDLRRWPGGEDMKRAIGSILAIVGLMSLVGQFALSRTKPDGDAAGRIAGYFMAFVVMLIGVAMSSKKKPKADAVPQEQNASANKPPEGTR